MVGRVASPTVLLAGLAEAVSVLLANWTKLISYADVNARSSAYSNRRHNVRLFLLL